MVYCIVHTRIMSTAGGGRNNDIKSNQDLFKRDIELLNKKLGRVACMYGFHHM